MSTSNTTSATQVPFFKAGDLTAADGRRITFSAADLQAIASSYEPTLSRAPFVVGHPELDDPAFGWAKSLSVQDGLLVADAEQVEAQFAQMVNDGRFPNRSASIYLPTTPGNPKPGTFYLKHIGFLGAAAPSIAGLPPVKFAADDKALSFSFDPADLTPELPMTDKTITPNPADAAANFAQQQADLDQRAADLATKEAKFNADKVAAERTGAVSFAQGLVQTGQVLPAESDAVVELIMALPDSTAPVSFSQSGSTVKKPARDMFRELLGGLPARVKYDEKAAGRVNQSAVSFSAPVGAQVDAGRADQYAQIKELQAKNKGLSVVDAARLVGA